MNSFTSNWKELWTVLLSLERYVKETPSNLVKDSLFVNFTDNRVTYYNPISGKSSADSLHEFALRAVQIVTYHRLKL